MSEIVPTTGRIVLYRLSETDVTSIRVRRRQRATLGNEVEVGDVYPAIVVKAWGDTPTSAVNLKVQLDGEDAFWATSRSVGETPGHFHWMAYQKKVASGEEQPNLHATKTG